MTKIMKIRTQRDVVIYTCGFDTNGLCGQVGSNRVDQPRTQCK